MCDVFVRLWCVFALCCSGCVVVLLRLRFVVMCWFVFFVGVVCFDTCCVGVWCVGVDCCVIDVPLCCVLWLIWLCL